MTLFRSPAIAVMNRLKYPQKFVLIGLLFALPLALVMYFFLSEINNSIAFSRKEIEGTQYLRALRGLLEHAGQHQLYALDSVSRGGSRQSDLVRKQNEIEEDFKSLAGLHAVLSELLQTSTGYDALLESWRALRAQPLESQPRAKGDSYVSFILGFAS